MLTNAKVKATERFSYVKYDQEAINIQSSFKDDFVELSAAIEETLGESRASALAQTALEEAYMWIGKAVRDAQIARGVVVEEQPERNNE